MMTIISLSRVVNLTVLYLIFIHILFYFFLSFCIIFLGKSFTHIKMTMLNIIHIRFNYVIHSTNAIVKTVYSAFFSMVVMVSCCLVCLQLHDYW